MVVVMVTAALRVVVVISTYFFNCIFWGGIHCIGSCSGKVPQSNCRTPDLPNSPVQLLIGKSGRLYIRLVVWSFGRLSSHFCPAVRRSVGRSVGRY